MSWVIWRRSSSGRRDRTAGDRAELAQLLAHAVADLIAEADQRRVGDQYRALAPPRRRLTTRSESSTPRCLETFALVPPVAATSPPTEASPASVNQVEEAQPGGLAQHGEPARQENRELGGQVLHRPLSITRWLNGHVDMALAVPFGIAIGRLVGTVGGGGATRALPILVYVLGQGVGPASTASLIVVALGALFGAGSEARDGRFAGEWRSPSPRRPRPVPISHGRQCGGEPAHTDPVLRPGDVRGSGDHLPPRRRRRGWRSDRLWLSQPTLAIACATGLVVGVMTGSSGLAVAF